MFVKIKDGAIAQYPFSLQQLRLENPNVSFSKNPSDESLAAYGVYRVGYQAAPEYNRLTERLVHSDQPSLIDGEWVLTKTVVSLTDEQIEFNRNLKAADVRNQRNELLAKTDWTQISDAPVDKTAWASYRQALRDISAQEGFPYSISWPEKP